jgi:hypothetical protein
MLQEAGIAAGPVLNSRDLLADAHLRARRFYELVEHAQPIGVRPIIGRPYRFRFRDLRIQKSAPRFGEDNGYVLRELLSLSNEQIAQLYAAGIVSDRPTVPVTASPQNFEHMLQVGSLTEVDPDYDSRFGGDQAAPLPSVREAVPGD